MSVAPAEKPPEEVVAGKYRLTRLLGRGGMGSVWEGIHTSLGTRVAVKFIEAEYATSQEARNRFENEARAAAKLRSKHVVQIYDHGVTTDGHPFIVMELLAGEPLDRRLDRVGRLAPAETSKILQQVCRALGRAHEAGIVHRDLKPENIFLVWDEEDGADIAKVVDFGIAKFTDGSVGVSSATRTGSVLGTPYYMSPEQARGLRSVDFRSDIWSVGVITYRCLVGDLPFSGEAIGDLLVKICTAPVPVPSQIAPYLPSSFDAWFAKALERDPARRFPSALAASDAFNAAFGFAGRAPMPSTAGTQRSADFAAPARSHQQVGYTPPTEQMAPFQSGVLSPSYGMGTPDPRSASGNESNFTGAPLTHTPTLNRSARASLLGIIALACLLVGIGVAVAVKLLHKTSEPEPAAEPIAGPSRASDAPGASAANAGTAEASLPSTPPAAPKVSAATNATAKPEPKARGEAPDAKHLQAKVGGTPFRPAPRLPPAPNPDTSKPRAPKPGGAIDVGY